MTTHAAGLDAILASLASKRAGMMKAAADKTAERGSTSHPVDKQDNGTGAATTGARSAENTADSKAQNPLNPDTAGSASAKAPIAGSQGVDAKDATQAPADKPDTSGKSEMGAKDTTHPTKSARSLLQERIKKAAEGLPKQETKVEETAEEKKKREEAKETPAQETAEHAKEAADKEAADKFASYCEGLVKECPDDFAAGCKFAMEVLASVVQAAQEKNAAAGMPGAEGDPAAAAAGGMPGAEGAMPGAEGAMPGAEGAGGGDELEQLAAELEAAGVTPEQLAQALQAEEGGQATPGDDQQVQALQEAMQAEGTSPEELAGMVGAEGSPAAGAEGSEGAPAAAAGDAAKVAADKHAALVTELRTQIRTLKAAKAQAKK